MENISRILRLMKSLFFITKYPNLEMESMHIVLLSVDEWLNVKS